MISFKPVISEKSIKLIESENVLIFQTEKEANKKKIKEEFEKMFNVKIKNIRTHIRDNKKYVYIKLKKEFPAIDIAMKLGVI
ncbi:MAG: 50S ribosomal protein L23 [Candidatus Pacearchaeota archaeon]|nr:MAG: 50S ribosomal protein L23 [Candidatus Pacearchaeota archaeon]